MAHGLHLSKTRHTVLIIPQTGFGESLNEERPIPGIARLQWSVVLAMEWRRELVQLTQQS